LPTAAGPCPPPLQVQWHDASRQRKRMAPITDIYRFHLAALSARAAVFACPPSADAPSTIMLRQFDCWAPPGDSTAPLPAGEEAVAVAVGAPRLNQLTGWRLVL
jgi:chromosome transmission fidelity protein 4